MRQGRRLNRPSVVQVAEDEGPNALADALPPPQGAMVRKVRADERGLQQGAKRLWDRAAAARETRRALVVRKPAMTMDVKAGTWDRLGDFSEFVH